MMRRFHEVALVCGWLALACGGDDDGGNEGGGGTAGTGSGGPVDTGLPEQTPLEDVTAEEYASACEALRQEVGDRLGPDEATRGVCEAFGAATTNDEAQCNSAADTCLTQIDPGPHPMLGISRADLDFTSFECGDVGELEGCSVTVREFETCLEDQMQAFESAMAGSNCANADSVDLTQALVVANVLMTPPESCARVEQECPGVGPFGDL